MQTELKTDSRIHIGLEAFELERSISFYSLLLGAPPSKLRPGYAKFEPGSLRLNLSIVETGRHPEPRSQPGHFGIEVSSSQAVGQIAQRLAEAGLELEHEEGVDCCYAFQDKVWARDPDGNRWEIFHVLDEGARLEKSSGSTCCVAPASAGNDTEGASCFSA